MPGTLIDMKFVDVVVLLDALLLIVFGVLGYIEKQSIPSLAAGVAFGGLLLGALAFTKTNPRVGRISSAVIALLPLGRFLPSFLKEQKIYPAGIVVFAGIITVAVLLGGHFVARAKSKSAQ